MIHVSNQLEDDGRHVHKYFNKENTRPLLTIHWVAQEVTHLDAIARIDNTKRCVSQQVNKLRERNAPLTYELMGIVESSSFKDETIEESQDESNNEDMSILKDKGLEEEKDISEGSQLRGLKRKEAPSKEPQHKRHKSRTSHSMASTSLV